MPKPSGFDSTACYAPHRDVIDSPDQVQIYEPVVADTIGQISHVLLTAGGYLKDNRIPPVGFVESGGPFELATASAGVEGDADFHTDASGRDTVHYRIGLAGQPGPFTVRAELLYQSVRPTFVAVLAAETDRVATYRSYYDGVPPVPETLAVAESTVDGDLIFGNGFEP